MAKIKKTSANAVTLELQQILTDAVEAHKKGDIDQAMMAYKKVLKHRPDNFVANHFYGLGLTQRNKMRESIPYFKKAIAGNAKWPIPYIGLASTLIGLNRFREALQITENALQHDPKNVQVLQLRAQILSQTGRLSDSINTALLALQYDPNNKDSLLTLSTSYHALGQYDRALDICEKIVASYPDHANTYCIMGAIYHQKGLDDKSIEYLEKAIALNPNHIAAHSNLGVCYRAIDDYEKSLHHYRKAIELHPEFSEAWGNMGNVLRVMGRSEESLEAYREALRINPSSMAAHSNYLMSLHYAADIDRQYIYDQTIAWDKKFSKGLKPSKIEFTQDRSRDKKLRVGMVSNSFRRHPVGYMIIQGLENMDKDKVEFIAYSGVPKEKHDQITHRLQKACVAWREINGTPDDALEQLMRQDQCDVMLDLSGHSETGRLAIFCRRVAPVQVEWVGGLFDTSGLAEMDWIIGDDIEIPHGDEKWYSEKVYRMPDDYICYDAPDYMPDIIPQLPALRPDNDKKIITFGNYNNLAKISPVCVRIWSRILTSVPNSQLLLKTKGGGQEGIKAYLTKLFTDQGIEANRIICEEGDPHRAFLDQYNRLDIAFDPHPYTGGLTTIEALMMGVPVITLPAEHFAGRHAASHLTCAGLADWVAKDEDDYHDLAVKWANDLDGLQDLRGKLRAQVSASPLMDGPKFAANLEKAFRHMWHAYLDEEG